jgi:hypothetical protein
VVEYAVPLHFAQVAAATMPASEPLNSTPVALVPARSEPATRQDAHGHPVDSIENATADLLRPMLRQWLAENMPRMVEKALYIEVAESVKGPRKPSE